MKKSSWSQAAILPSSRRCSIVRHFLAAAPNGWMLEWPVAALVTWADLFPNAPHPVEGMLALPDRPGWGLRPDEAVMLLFAMPQLNQ